MNNLKDIPGYEGLYQADENGNVYSLQTKKFLKPSISQDGYKQYVFHKDHKQHCMPAHRATALAFIPRDTDNLVVNHKDENKLNCNINNLEWVTRKENNEYMGNRAAQATIKNHSKEFYVFDKNGELIEEFRGINKYAREHNLSSGCLATIIKKNTLKERKYTYHGLIYVAKEDHHD